MGTGWAVLVICVQGYGDCPCKNCMSFLLGHWKVG
jgi:hypothetical protein